jgi:prepilin-type N-terminal cleavage/methylation domain-containing protein
MKKNNNCGFSLVEIVITIAIMAVLTGTVSYGLSLSSGKKAEECARKLASELQSMRTMSLGKYEVIGELSYDSNSDSYILKRIVRNSSADKDKSVDDLKPVSIVVGDGAVDIYCYDGDVEPTSTDKTLKNSGTVTFQFSRSTEALVSGTTKIKVSKANKTMYINIEELTGRVTVSS